MDCFTYMANTTKSCIRAGVLYGLQLEIQGFIKTYLEQYSDMKFIFCGGYSDYFQSIIEEQLSISVISSKYLSLYGLIEILKWNT